MNIQLSNRQTVAVLAGSLLLALGIGSGLKLRVASGPSPVGSVADETALAPPETSAAPSPSTFEQPLMGVSPRLRLVDPALLQSTPQEERVINVAAGRANPFAPITRPAPGASRNQPSAPASQVTAPPVPPQPVSTVPVSATQALPPLPPMSAVPPADTTPTSTVAVAPNAALPLPSTLQGETSVPMSPLDRVEISGIVQLSGRVRVIIREVGAGTSRHVAVGDQIAGGQVRIKRVDLSGSEPLVVLEYNGQEVYRSVGSASLTGLS